MPGFAWIRNQSYSGPYTGKKWMYYLADEGSSTHSTSKRNVNNNYRLLKMSAVILWLAECETELGNLQAAEDYTNMVRTRAKVGFCTRCLCELCSKSLSKRYIYC